MKYFASAALVMALIAAWTLHAVAAQQASLDLLRRAMDPNPALHSYDASATLKATLQLGISVPQTYTGTVYYLKPKRKIVFDNIPGALSKFKELASSSPTLEQMQADYDVVPATDDGSMSTYTLTPKNPGGRVKSLTLTVDDRAALVHHTAWKYTDGSTLDFSETDESVGDFKLPSTVTIAAHFPAYSVDGTLEFSKYRPNVHVDPSVFADPQ